MKKMILMLTVIALNASQDDDYVKITKEVTNSMAQGAHFVMNPELFIPTDSNCQSVKFMFVFHAAMFAAVEAGNVAEKNWKSTAPIIQQLFKQCAEEKAKAKK